MKEIKYMSTKGAAIIRSSSKVVRVSKGNNIQNDDIELAESDSSNHSSSCIRSESSLN